jgi:hypothetical protein
MLVAAVLTACAVLKVGAAIAVVAAATQLGVERVEGLDVESGQRQRAEQWPNKRLSRPRGVDVSISL